MFKIIRFILLLLLIGISVFVIVRSNAKRKRRAVLFSVVICVLLVTVSSVFPPENIFVQYPSPESVSNYMNGYNIYDTVSGNDSCKVIFQNQFSPEHTWGSEIILKTETGYRIPTPFFSKTILRRVDENGAIEIERVNGCTDYYLQVMIHVNGEIRQVSIINDAGDAIEPLDIAVRQGRDILVLYISLDQNPEGCCLLVGDLRITI